MTSLNPVFSIGNQVGEAIKIHQDIPKRTVVQQVLDVLRKVNIPAAETRVRDYPHQMSGGMRQRVVGAIGISCEPIVLIADEPTTSLDVTIQAQYLKLLKELQEASNIGLIFITHDFGIVAKMCDRVAVMYAGRDRRDGRRAGHLQQPVAPLHRGPVVIGPEAGRGRGSPVFHRGATADAPRLAAGLPLRAPLPIRHGQMPGNLSVAIRRER